MSEHRIDGLRVVITGATSGIGKAAALELARLGGALTIVCRNEAKGRATIDEIQAAVLAAEVSVVICDLSDLGSVRAAAKELGEKLDRIDILVNNAGVNNNRAASTPDGFDHMMASNYLGPFLLTHLVLDKVEAAAPSRIVVVGSEAHRVAGRLDPERFEDLGPYNQLTSMQAYGRTKLLDILFASELARRLEGSGVTVNSLCPGLVATNLVELGPLRGLAEFATRTPLIHTPAQGARIVVRVATDPALDGVTGQFFSNTPGLGLLPPVAARRDEQLQKRIWERTSELLELTATGV